MTQKVNPKISLYRDHLYSRYLMSREAKIMVMICSLRYLVVPTISTPLCATGAHIYTHICSIYVCLLHNIYIIFI